MKVSKSDETSYNNFPVVT